MGKPNIAKLQKKKKVDKILDALNYDDQIVRQEAIIALGEMGITQATKALCDNFEQKRDRAIHENVVNTLTSFGDPIISEMVEYGQTKAEYTRRKIVQILGKILTEQAFTYLIQFKDQDTAEKVREDAAEILKKHEVDFNGALFSKLDDPSLEKREEGAVTLILQKGLGWKTFYPRSIQEKILDALPGDKYIDDPRPEIKYVALDVLVRQGIENTHKICELLPNADADFQERIGEKLIRFGTSGVPVLCQQLVTTNQIIQYFVIQALGKIKDTSAVPHLIIRMQNAPENILIKIIESLGEIGNTQATNHIAVLYQNPSAGVRQAVSTALGNLKDQNGLGALLHLISDQDTEVRIAAIIAIGILKNAQAIPYLIPLLKNDDKNIRAAAVKSLGKIGGEQAAQALRVVIEDEDVIVRREVVNALGKMAGEETINLLIEALLDKETIIAMTAAQALGLKRAERATKPLCNMLLKGEPSLRRHAAKALIKIGNCVVDDLCGCLDTEDSDIKEETLEALAEIGDARALDPIIKLLDDANEGVQEGAANALQDLEKEGNISPLSADLKEKIKSILHQKIQA